LQEQDKWIKCPKCVDKDNQCYYLLKDNSSEKNDNGN